MDVYEAMRERHSVRRYKQDPVPADVVKVLQDGIGECNKESGLNFQLVLNEPRAFGGMMARYGKFSGVSDYIALVGRKSGLLDELCGYYGERLVLLAQTLGLNSCWVGLTYKKVPSAFTVGRGEELAAVIALGYGVDNGVAHKSKSMDELMSVKGPAPEWFLRGMEAAMLAPTAMNQQKFRIYYEDGRVKAVAGRGFYTKMDLGIVKYHFELGSRDSSWTWA